MQLMCEAWAKHVPRNYKVSLQWTSQDDDDDDYDEPDTKGIQTPS